MQVNWKSQCRNIQPTLRTGWMSRWMILSTFTHQLGLTQSNQATLRLVKAEKAPGFEIKLATLG